MTKQTAISKYGFNRTFTNGDAVTLPNDFRGGSLLFIYFYRYGHVDYAVICPTVNSNGSIKCVGSRNISLKANAESNPTQYTISTSSADKMFCHIMLFS